MKYLILALLLVSALFTACADNEKGASKEESEMEYTIKKETLFDGSVAIALPEEDVIPYHEKAYKYLSKENGKVHYYYDSSIKNPGVDTVISWSCTHEDITGYTVEYGVKEDFSEVFRIETTEDSIALNNLYKDTTYYISVVAHGTSESYGVKGSFKTTALGPRVMTVDGIYNVRDIGGYKTDGGKTTLQGMIYRGGQMDGTYVDKPVNITEKGIATMLNVMKIKHDMDLRGANEQELPQESPIPGATFKRYGFSGYNTQVDTESGKENLRAVFSALADPENYPVYIHCQGGADRTGVLCFMINALLGVDINDLIHDYEFTTFSLYGTRSTTSGAYLPYHDKIRSLLNRFEGDSIMEKVENLLLYAGVTPEEIASIRSIMLGE